MANVPAGNSAVSTQNPYANPYNDGYQFGDAFKWFWQPGNPGNWIFDPLDLKGKRAAKAQYQNQLALDERTRAFNSAEAQAQRDFEKRMSNNQYQRLTEDLKKAGLNPWLALNGGSMNPNVPSGSSASSSSGQANMPASKLAVAAGVIATALRLFLTKGK